MTQEYLKSILRYENGKMYWIKNIKNHPDLFLKEAGSIRKTKSGYRCYIKIDSFAYPRSRLIFLYNNGYLPKIVDHINGNTIDDRIENLREATDEQNQWNRSFHENQGIRILKSGRYNVRITVNKKEISLGTFDTIEEARKIYVESRRKYYKQFFRG